MSTSTTAHVSNRFRNGGRKCLISVGNRVASKARIQHLEDCWVQNQDYARWCCSSLRHARIRLSAWCRLLVTPIRRIPLEDSRACVLRLPVILGQSSQCKKDVIGVYTHMRCLAYDTWYMTDDIWYGILYLTYGVTRHSVILHDRTWYDINFRPSGPIRPALKSSIWKSRPRPWENWICKGHVEVTIINGSRIRDPQFKIVRIEIISLRLMCSCVVWIESIRADRVSLPRLRPRRPEGSKPPPKAVSSSSDSSTVSSKAETRINRMGICLRIHQLSSILPEGGKSRVVVEIQRCLLKV